MNLENKVAIVYGARGSIGAAVSDELERQGARVVRTGRAEVDALDEAAVDSHLRRVVDEHHHVDISFNAIGIDDRELLGMPVTELSLERFTRPLLAYATSWFLTARAAAQVMVPRKSGVIMTISALHSRCGIPLVGGYGPAQAAKEAFTRGLSAEVAPHGVRVVGLRPQAMPESSTIREAWEPRAAASGLSWEQWQAALAARTHSRRLMRLDELARVAAFVASDAASGLTGTTLNLTMGSVDD